MNLKDNLKRIRKDNNLSQEQLAEKLGVSRQSVSKWENGEAYPEMDKVLQICKMFNLNIDELLNQDIKDVNEVKQSKINIDKYVGDFLDYITKTIDLFSSMKFKDKIKCLVEQCFIAVSIVIVCAIVGGVGSNLVHSILFFVPSEIYYDVYNIFSGLYFVFCFVVGVMLMLHIFKIRYLDYFVVVENEEKQIEDKVLEEDKKADEKEVEKDIKSDSDNKKIFNRKDEKVIIRDPKHSKNNFISLLVRGILFMIKCFVFCMGLFFSFTLICLVFCFVVSFLIANTGILFIGCLLVIGAGIIINLVILNIIYNFIKSIKSKTKVLMIMFIISLILVGVGGGLFCMGALDFEYVEASENMEMIQTTERMEMRDDLFIDHWGYVEYIESDNDDLKFVYEHSSYSEVSYVDNGYGGIWFNDQENIIDMVKKVIDDLGDEKIVEYGCIEVKVYTSKENIEKLKQNKVDYYNNEKQLREYYEEKIEEYEEYIEELETVEEEECYCE